MNGSNLIDPGAGSDMPVSKTAGRPGHVVLLGDSIFDNAAYVPGQPPVIEQLRAVLPDHWRATLLAVDGSVTLDLAAQLSQLPADCTDIVISSGGNDALAHLDRLHAGTDTVLSALTELARLRGDFQADYRPMLAHVCAIGCRVRVCTIYDAVPVLSDALRTALCLYNDTIQHEAARAGVPVIDLRLICTEDSDFSAVSPIEPSCRGGLKIARAIAAAVLG